ncbi:unnamed protein product [Arctogadus glacialis]
MRCVITAMVLGNLGRTALERKHPLIMRDNPRAGPPKRDPSFKGRPMVQTPLKEADRLWPHTPGLTPRGLTPRALTPRGAWLRSERQPTYGQTAHAHTSPQHDVNTSG